MTTSLDDASTDSDDSDVAFANLDFDGVDFGSTSCWEDDDAGADAADDTPAAEGGVPPPDSVGDDGDGGDVDCEEAAEEHSGGRERCHSFYRDS